MSKPPKTDITNPKVFPIKANSGDIKKLYYQLLPTLINPPYFINQYKVPQCLHHQRLNLEQDLADWSRNQQDINSVTSIFRHVVPNIFVIIL